MGGIHCLSSYLVYVFFCDVQAAFGAFYGIEKQPALAVSVKRIKAVEEILNHWTRRALDDEMPGDLFLVALSPIALKRCV